MASSKSSIGWMPRISHTGHWAPSPWTTSSQHTTRHQNSSPLPYINQVRRNTKWQKKSNGEKMQVAKEKMKDMTSKAKEKKEVQKAKSEEKAEKRESKSREEKDIAHELSKARQAEAKMEYHLERAEHRAETLAHRAAGTNPVPTHSVIPDGGAGGTFYNAQGQPIGGRPGGGAVDSVLPPGVGNAASMYGGTPARPGGAAVDSVHPPGVGNAVPMHDGMPARPPVGAVYPPGVGNGTSTDGASAGQNNYA